MHETILVTGATGTVGAALLNELLPDRRDGRVRLIGATRSAAARAGLREQGVTGVAIDFTDRASVDSAMAGVDRVFLCTGYAVDMLEHSKVAIDAAVHAGVEQIVHLGGLAPAGAADLPHFAWHAYVEAYIERQPLAWCHLQPRTFMENVFAALPRQGTVLRHFYGNAPIEWIAAEDVARVAAAALRDPERHKGRAYRLAEDVMTMGEVAHVLALQTGIPFSAEARDPATQPAALLKAGIDPLYAASLARATELVARGVVGSAAPFDPVLDVTGQPGTRWRDFAARHAARFAERAVGRA